jgi:hypothetical protein
MESRLAGIFQPMHVANVYKEDDALHLSMLIAGTQIPDQD